MSDVSNQLASAKSVYEAAQNRFEGLRGSDDTKAKADAETAFMAARKALRALEAQDRAEQALQETLVTAKRRDEFDDKQAAIADRQKTVFTLLQDYGREITKLDEQDRQLRRDYADLARSGPLPTAEMLWRHRDGQPEKIISRAEGAEQWISHVGYPLDPQLLSRLQPGKDEFTGRLLVGMAETFPIKEAAYETTFLPSVAPFAPEPLAKAIHIPADPAPVDREPKTRLERRPGVRPYASSERVDFEDEDEAA